MKEKKTYLVEIEAVTNHQFIVEDCWTPEEAESIAVGLLKDGDPGGLLSEEITNIDSVAASKEDFN